MAISYPQPKRFEEIIKSRSYVVPMYQRPYSWLEQVSELWSDINENNPPYFIGILMLKPLGKDEKSFEVVDGQQRLATLLLLLRAAVITLESEDPISAKEIQDSYINQKRPLTSEPILTLEMNRRDKPKFESLMLNTTIINKNFASWKCMENAIKYFSEKLKEMKTTDGISGVKKFILEKVMELRFLDVHVHEDNDIFLFFETLNDRGMDLSIADLVKNRVCAMANKEETLDVNDVARKIDEITDLIGAGKMKSFFLHYCWSKSDESMPPPQKKLMEWYGSSIDNEKNNFLLQIEEAAISYSDFVNPRKIKASSRKQVLTYLNTLNATRCYPLLLQGQSKLSLKDFVRLCNAIEILTFRHSTVAKKDAKSLESVYYQLTKDIRNEVNIAKVLEVLKMVAKETSDEVFVANLKEYQPENHKIARYILLRIEDDKKSLELDWDSLTLEHILAEKLDWIGKDEYLDRLGNYTLLSDPLNKEVANKEFSRKKIEYMKEKRFQLTKDLTSYSDFTIKQIIERQEKFATKAQKIWNPENIK